MTLLDIHVSPPLEGPSGSETPSQSRIEILDAGTGHGAVTLHLARAIAAANSSPPASAYVSTQQTSWATTTADPDSSSFDPETESNSKALDNWRSSRRAIVHTVEISPIYSNHARKRVIAGFRRALYLPHIDFHVGNVHDWIGTQLQERGGEGFLDHAFLDMPGSDRYLGQVARGLKAEGSLVVFVPSVTQIGDCVAEVRRADLPLFLEKVVEVGEGISTGRLWDVRSVMARNRNALDVKEEPREKIDGSEGESGAETEGSESAEEVPSPVLSKATGGEPVMVCRPKVGEKTMGGGFIGLWRRKSSD